MVDLTPEETNFLLEVMQKIQYTYSQASFIESVIKKLSFSLIPIPHKGLDKVEAKE